MAKGLTKAAMEDLLLKESEAWGRRMQQYQAEGNLVMAEQALGRQLEAEWVYAVFTGRVKEQ